MKAYPKVRCPTCKRYGDWFTGRYGPFCSERCHLIDLGKWLNEDYRISEPLRPEHLDQLEDLPPSEDSEKRGWED